MTAQMEPTVDHPVRARLEDLSGRIARLDLTGNEGYKEQVRHTAAAVEYAATHVAALSPELASTSMLDGLVAPVDQLFASLDQYDADRNAAYLDQTGPQADQLLTVVATLPAPASSAEVQAVRERATAVRAAFGDLVDELRVEKDALSTQIGELEAQVAAAKVETATQATTFAGELDQLRAAITEQTTRVDARLTSFDEQASSHVQTSQAAFDAARDKELTALKTAADTALEQFSVASTAATGEFVEATTTARTEFEERGQAAVARLEELKDKAANLVGVVTGTATAGGYKKVADEERDAANIWRWICLASVAVVAAIGVWIVIVASGSTSFDWGHFAAKAFLTVPFGAAAAYAANQSSGHRDTERRLRHAQLQLAALEPYVESLSEEQAQQVRTDLATHLFGPVAEAAGAESKDKTISAVLGLAKDVSITALKNK